MTNISTPLAGILAEFSEPTTLKSAAEKLRDDGYQKTDAFSPIPVEGLFEALGQKESAIPWIVLSGGLFGGIGMFALAWWVSAVAYPLNVGGRPLLSWPSFIPPTFEGTILGAATAAVLGVLYLCRLPRLHHPVFEVERFRRASTDAFFLWVASDDALFDAYKTMSRLQELGASEVWEVTDEE